MYFAFFAILSMIVFNVHSEETVKVSLYIEALCPDTKVFINKQFYPGYQRLSPHLEIEVIPYGLGYHTHINGVWNFQCQHGYRECYGNRVQSCAIAQNYDRDTLMSWFNCIFTHASPVSGMRPCALEIGLNWENLEHCSQETEQGYELLAVMGEKTQSLVPKLKYVPTIVFNDVYDQTLQNAAEADFFGTVCSLLNEKPAACFER